MSNIIKEILGQLPKEKISDAVFEGANIVLYTKDKEFFLDNEGMIKKIVDDIKKRIELRPDPGITLDTEKAEKAIKKYRALIEFSNPIADKDIKKIEKEFQNKVLQQRTPNRVSHRRADKIREKKVYNVECTRKGEAEIEIIVECDGGCYVKELISGDEGRTKPSISEIAINPAICTELDVIKINEIPYNQED